MVNEINSWKNQLTKETWKRKLFDFANEGILVFIKYFAYYLVGFVRKKENHYVFQVQHILEKR